MSDPSSGPRRRAAGKAAAEFVVAAHTNDRPAALAPLARMEREFGIEGVRALVAEVLVELHRSCPTARRGPHGGTDLELLSPELDSPVEVLLGADHVARTEDRDAPDAAYVAKVEQHVARAISLRPLIQGALDIIAVQHDDSTAVLVAVEVLAPLPRVDLIATLPLLASAVRACTRP